MGMTVKVKQVCSILTIKPIIVTLKIELGSGSVYPGEAEVPKFLSMFSALPFGAYVQRLEASEGAIFLFLW